MRPERSWNIDGIPAEAREAVKAAARSEGLSVGEWLTRRILRSFSDAGAEASLGEERAFPGADPARFKTAFDPGAREMKSSQTNPEARPKLLEADIALNDEAMSVLEDAFKKMNRSLEAAHARLAAIILAHEAASQDVSEHA